MTTNPYIHSCRKFDDVLEHEAVEIKHGLYYATFAHWYEKKNSTMEIDYSVRERISFCPFCGVELRRIPTLTEIAHGYVVEDTSDR
jgi:hypothetical protein